jgi:hypothetical protein
MMKITKKISLQKLKEIALSLLFFASTNAIAASCLDVFPTVLSSSEKKGKVEIEREVDVNGTNGSLDIEINKDETTSINPSCITQKCIGSNKRAEAFSLPRFQTSSSTINSEVNNGDTLSLPQGSYKNIKVEYQATLRFTQNNEASFIKNLSVDSETTVIFEEGVYWIETFTIGYRTNIIIEGNEKVTLIIENRPKNSDKYSLEFDQSEVSFNAGGTTDQLVLIAYEDVNFGYKANFKGFIYADKNVELKNENVFEGAINGDSIKLKYQAAITYAPDSIESANFNGFCTASANLPAALAGYQF